MPGRFIKELEAGKSKDQWEKAINNPYISNCLLWVNDEAAGFITTGPVRSSETADCEFQRMYLLKKFQGLGLGRIMMHKAAKTELSKGSKSMVVRVLAENTAFKLYEKYGAEFLRQYTITLGSKEVLEYVYRWEDISLLFNNTAPSKEIPAHNL